MERARSARLLPVLLPVVLPVLLGLLVVAAPVAAQLEIALVPVGDPGNAADTNGLGDVADAFRIGTFEITNTEYVAFLDAVAASDPNGLFDTIMTSSDRGGILRSGVPGGYSYSIKPDFDDKPANGFGWLEGSRFCNWLHNGQPVGPQGPGTTESGAYDMSLAPEAIARAPGALYFWPTHDEWYKAAYYDPFDAGADASGTPDYWLYTTRSDSAPTKATADDFGDVINPGPNVANHDKGASWNDEFGNVTTVGGCAAPSPWGAFDLGGNILEYTETPDNPIPGSPPLPTRTARGGDFSNPTLLLSSPDVFSVALNMAVDAANVGMRVASRELWEDLGGAVPGTAGTPRLEGLGSLLGDTPVHLTLRDARPNALATLVLGVSFLGAPFKGGVLVPSPDAIIAGLPTGPGGEFLIPFTWPAGIPAGVSTWWQIWIPDPAAVFGFAGTNGVVGTTP